jgi:hypothetical protein
MLGVLGRTGTKKAPVAEVEAFGAEGGAEKGDDLGRATSSKRDHGVVEIGLTYWSVVRKEMTVPSE